MTRLKREAWVPALLASLSLVFLADFLSPPPNQYLGGDDVVGQLVQSLNLAIAEVRAGHWPLWNPYLSSGLPLWANPQPGLLYLPNWILLGLPLNVGLSWLAAFHLFWVSLGFYVWARAHRLSIGGGLVGAITISYCGFLVVRVADGHPNFVATLSWLPWVMAALEYSLRRRTWRSALVAGLPIAMSLYAGNPAGSFLMGLLALLWTLAEMIWPPTPVTTFYQRWGQPLLQLALATTVAVGIAAAQLLPTLELISRSVRGSNQGYAFASEYSLPPAHLISILAPNFFGEPVTLGYWGEGRHTEFILYPGLLALGLMFVALRSGLGDRRVRLWVGIAILGLLLALGPAGGLHPLVYQLVPFLGLIRAPVRFAFWSIFAVASLAAWAVDYLQNHPNQNWSLPIWSVIGPFALGALALGAYTLAPSGDARLYHIGTGFLVAGFFLGLSRLWLGWRPHMTPAGFAVLGAVLTMADLWGYGRHELRTINLDRTSMWQETATLIGDHSPPVRVLPWGVFLFFENNGMDHNLASVFSYDPLILANYQSFTDSVTDPRATTFDLLNAEYALIPADQDWSQEPSLSLVGRAADFNLYQRTAALPRAWVVKSWEVKPSLSETLTVIHAPGFDPRATALVLNDPACPVGEGGQASFTSYIPNAVVINAQGSGILILADAWYPGWQADIDGHSTTVLQVDGVLRGICLPPGNHTITFRFDPPIVKWGLAVSGISLLLLALYAIRNQRVRRTLN